MLRKAEPWSRRRFLELGLAGVGLTGAGLIVFTLGQRQTTKVKVPHLPRTEATAASSFNPLAVLRNFDYGTVKQENGRTIREFLFEARNSTLQLTKAVDFASWNINGRIPGPTIRANVGDRIWVIFHNQAGHSHSLHFQNHRCKKITPKRKSNFRLV